MSRRWLLMLPLLLPLAVIGGLYVYESFVYANPMVRIALRVLPVVPATVWTLWFDAARPFEHAAGPIKAGGRVAVMVGVMAVAILVLGIGLNWVYDPSRIL